MRDLKKLVKNYVGLIIVVLSGLIPLTWFKDGLLIAGGDEFALLNPGSLTEYFKYTWNIKLLNEGGVIFSIPNLVPITYFWTSLQSVGFSLLTVEKLWFIFLFLGPGLSMYYLVSQFFDRNWIKVISSILYMFNLFIIVAVPFNSHMKPVLIALPLSLVFWAKGLNSKKSHLKYAFLIGLCSLIYASSSVNPPSVSPIPVVLVSYLIGHILSSRQKSYFRIIKFILATIFCYLIMNFWWIGVFLLTFVSEATSIKEAIPFGIATSNVLHDFLRLLGSWGWNGVHYKMPYIPFARLYDEPFLLILSFIIPLLSFLAVVLQPKNKKILFFGLLALFGIFLSKGTAQPFGFIYKWMFQKIPFFWTFREPFAKFTPITLFSYSILIGFTTDTIYQKIKGFSFFKKNNFKLVPHLFPILVMLLIFFVSFPLINGETIWNYWNGSMRSLHTKVPDYWYEAADWLRQNDNSEKVFLTPKGGYGLAYDWINGFSTAENPSVIILDNPVLRTLPVVSYADNIVNKAYDYMNVENSTQFTKLLTLLNVKYILQQDDLDWRFAFNDTYSPSQIKKLLQNQEGVSYLKSFGRLDLYQIDSKKYLPTIYVPKAISYSNIDVNNLALAVPFVFEDEVRSGIFLNNSGLSSQEAVSFANNLLVEGKLEERVFDEEIGEAISKAYYRLDTSTLKPGSPFYRISLSLEKLNKAKTSSQDELFDLLLFYANRRITEVVSSPDFSKIVMRNYSEEIGQALEILKKMQEYKKKNFLSQYTKIKGTLQSNQLKTENLNIGEDEKEKIDSIFDNFFFQLNNLKQRNSLSQLEYLLDVPEEGDYELYVIDENNFLDFGRQFFKVGEQKFVLPIANLNENLIETNLTVKDYLPNTLYRISLNYKSYGQRARLSLSEGKKGKLFDITLPPTNRKNENNYKYFEMYFYSSNKAIEAFIDLSSDSFESFKLEKVYQPRLFLRKKSDSVSKTPSVLFVRVNPTKYEVGINGATDPFFLVLNESYNRNWKVYIKGSQILNKGDYLLGTLAKKFINFLFRDTSEEAMVSEEIRNYFNDTVKEIKKRNVFLEASSFDSWGLKPIREDRHNIVNGYANSWLITPEDALGKNDFELIIEFKNQRTFYLGIAVSAVGILILILSLSALKIKKRSLHTNEGKINKWPEK